MRPTQIREPLLYRETLPFMNIKGLLPEEVIVPVVEWFGDQQSLPFPDVSAPAGAARDRGQWVLKHYYRVV